MPDIGPDGNFYRGGPAFPGDRGGLNFGFTILLKERRGVLNFGTQLTFLSGSPADVRLIAQKFRERIREAFGEVSYAPAIAPLRVGIRASTVAIVLPAAVDMLVADVEIFLALADRLDEAAAKLEATEFPKETAPTYGKGAGVGRE